MTNSAQVTALVLAAGAFAVYLCLIGVGLRLSRQRYAVRLLIGSAVLVYATAAEWAQANVAIAQWHFAAFFGAAVAATVFAYGAALKALSLRMLIFIADAPDAAVTISSLADGVVRVSFVDRILLLENRNLIERVARGYVLTPAGKTSAARVRRVQELLNIRAAGLYWN
jgi:hypothetical protein